MITGFFGDEDALFFEIKLISTLRLELPVDAILDAGFSYWLAVDEQDVDALYWVRLERQTMITTRGEADFDIYAGKVKIDGQEYDIPVHVGNGLTEVLLGRQWLTDRRLIVDMTLGILTNGTKKSSKLCPNWFPASRLGTSSERLRLLFLDERQQPIRNTFPASRLGTRRHKSLGFS